MLKATYGVILYQEQVMQIAQVLAGYSLGEADLLRRAMGKKKPEEMAKQRSVFHGRRGSAESNTACRANFRPDGEIRRLRLQQVAFGGLCAVVLSDGLAQGALPSGVHGGSSDLGNGRHGQADGLRRDCDAEGLELLPPDVNASAYAFEVGGNQAIRYGLGAIKGLGRNAVESIVAARAEAPFASLDEFCQRVRRTASADAGLRR